MRAAHPLAASRIIIAVVIAKARSFYDGTISAGEVSTPVTQKERRHAGRFRFRIGTKAGQSQSADDNVFGIDPRRSAGRVDSCASSSDAGCSDSTAGYLAAPAELRENR